MYAKWCTMSNLAVPISRLYDFMDWILCSDDCWLVQTWQMLCGLKTILTDMNILNSYRHIRPKKVKYPIPEIPDDSGKKSGTDWVLPKIIGSGRVSGTRQALLERGLVKDPPHLAAPRGFSSSPRPALPRWKKLRPAHPWYLQRKYNSRMILRPKDTPENCTFLPSNMTFLVYARIAFLATEGEN